MIRGTKDRPPTVPEKGYHTGSSLRASLTAIMARVFLFTLRLRFPGNTFIFVVINDDLQSTIVIILMIMTLMIITININDK